LAAIRGVKRRRGNPTATNTACVEKNTNPTDKPDDKPSAEKRKNPAHVGHAEKSPTNAPTEPSQPVTADGALFRKAKTANDTFSPTSQETASRRIVLIGTNKTARFWVRYKTNCGICPKAPQHTTSTAAGTLTPYALEKMTPG
jgi:hypothetical protein